MRQADVAYIGIDVSKETLDFDAGDLGILQTANTPAQIRQALRGIARKAAGRPLQACFESTGPYTRDLAAECRRAGLPLSVLPPSRVACFARSLSLAKTDRIDASLIRRYAEVRRPAPTPEPGKARLALGALLNVRGRTVRDIAERRCMAAALAGSPAAAKPQRQAIAFLKKQLAACDRLIAEAVKADAELAGLTAALAGGKGVGALTAATVAAAIPEIGTLDRRKAAALAGLAPRTRESGKWKGRARIGGGRKRVRDALFMPATVAIRHSPEMRGLHARLTAKGKPCKVALAAVMRRLLCRLDSVARDYHARRGQPAG
jgi:transposase